MAKTVSEAFDQFLTWLTPTGTESAAAKAHRASIGDALRSQMGMTSFFRTGSFGNGTSIRGHSDVDYFAEFPSGQLSPSSTYSLQKIRGILDTRFPSTGVTVRSPAIVVPFGTDGSQTTEIVPGDFRRMVGGGRYRLYEIPDRANGWMEAVPDAHNAYVARVNDAHSGRAKSLVRFMKAWKYHRVVPVSSFYLEMRTAKFASEKTYLTYSSDIKQLFGQLLSANLAAMQDPTGYTGMFQPCATDTQQSEALSKLETAYTRADKAVIAEYNGRISEAFDYWGLVFDGQFPAYR